MKKFVLRGLVFVVLAIVVLGFFFKDRIQRARMAASLFSGAEQYELFCRVPDFFTHSVMPPADEPFQFGEGEIIELPAAFEYKEQPVTTETFLAETDTSALLVLKDGQVRFEQYMLTGGRKVPWLSMSVAKSFISAAVGIAVNEGHIESIEDPITKYVSKLAGSAYDGVRIKDILQMSSGARWNEDYSDPESDINQFGRIFAIGGSLDEFAATLAREKEPGTVNHYNSIDTQVLGMLLVSTTGRSISEYMTEKLWQPMGTESPGYWLIDSNGMEMAFGGLNATARDYAKLGELYRLSGQLNGKQIVPVDWVKASLTPDAPHLQPGHDPEFTFGYGYQWWIPEGDEGEFSAIGVYNQFIYVNPTQDVVIVKLSANSDYGTSQDESSYREMETIELFREIVDVLRTGASAEATPAAVGEAG
jgi:CubicO group peptidase (beta-lactamase class C family)